MLQAPTVCNDIQFKAKGNTMEAHSAADEAWHWLKSRYGTSGKELG